MGTLDPEPRAARGRPRAMIAARTPLAVALGAALLIAACAVQPTPASTGVATPTLEPTPTPGGSGLVEHPSGSDVVVLRLEEGGGIFGGMDFFATHLPTFSLYGDGTVLYAQSIVDPKGLAGPAPLRKATMDEAQMSALLGFALGQGGLAEARADYPNPRVADGPTSIFTVRAGGLDKTVGVYALGIESPETPDLAIRARFLEVEAILKDFGAQVAAGRATDAGTYDPPAYRAVLLEAQGVPGDVRGWPWPDPSPEDFAARPNDGRRYAVITPEQARQLAPSPEGGLFPVVVLGPDGVTYTVALRPLLPDENE